MVAGLVASAGVGACMAKCSGAAEKEKEKVSFWRPILAVEANRPWCWRDGVGGRLSHLGGRGGGAPPKRPSSGPHLDLSTT